MYGSSCLQGRRLHAISYKLKGLVRVKTNQLRRKQRSLHMTEQTRAFRAKGPGIFGGKRSRPQHTQQQAQAMKLFWTDIWEREGVYSAFHGSPVTHLMFVDDLKIYEESAAELQSTLEVAEGFSVAVGMTLGVRKCAVAHLRAGRVRSQGGVETERSTINEISRGDSYRYPGVTRTDTSG